MGWKQSAFCHGMCNAWQNNTNMPKLEDKSYNKSKEKGESNTNAKKQRYWVY